MTKKKNNNMPINSINNRFQLNVPFSCTNVITYVYKVILRRYPSTKQNTVGKR